MTNTEYAKQMLNQFFGGSWITQGIAVAAELDIADLLAGGPLTADELAKRTGARADPLYRVLRALASVGIFAEDQNGRFSLTPAAELLRVDGNSSQRAFAIMMGAEFHRAWGELLYSVRTGEHGFTKALGRPTFQYMVEHPERHEIYDAAMAGYGITESQAMLDAYDFSSFSSVADIGGGNGQMLAAILNRYPKIRGVLFDLPAVVSRAQPLLTASGLAERCSFIGGDFLASIEVETDAQVMRHILHDYSDDDAITILRNCRAAIPPGGKVLIVETVIPPGNDPCFGKWLDLMMLLIGGRERTEEEFRRLISAAGLTLDRIIPTASEVSVIECSRSM